MLRLSRSTQVWYDATVLWATCPWSLTFIVNNASGVILTACVSYKARCCSIALLALDLKRRRVRVKSIWQCISPPTPSAVLGMSCCFSWQPARMRGIGQGEILSLLANWRSCCFLSLESHGSKCPTVPDRCAYAYLKLCPVLERRKKKMREEEKKN